MKTVIIGHGGAGALAPANTIQSFQRAVDCGVDRIEFDVLWDNGQLWLAHDAHHLERALRFDEGLHFLADTGIALSCDLKSTEGTTQIRQCLIDAGVTDRTLICGHDRQALQQVTHDTPMLRGWSLPQSRQTRQPVHMYAPRPGLLWLWRRRIVTLATRALTEDWCDGLMVKHPLITRQLVTAIHDRGGFLHAWTIDDAAVAARLIDLGVDGITSNNPPLIQPLLNR